MDLNKLVKAYINIRDARSALKKEYETKDEELKQKLNHLETVMLQFLQTNNTDSVKTDAGTIYRQEEITPMCADWDILYNWILEHHALDILERRIKKQFVKDYMDSHDGTTPPGINVYRAYTARVRRS